MAGSRRSPRLSHHAPPTDQKNHKFVNDQQTIQAEHDLTATEIKHQLERTVPVSAKELRLLGWVFDMWVEVRERQEMCRARAAAGVIAIARARMRFAGDADGP